MAQGRNQLQAVVNTAMNYPAGSSFISCFKHPCTVTSSKRSTPIITRAFPTSLQTAVGAPRSVVVTGHLRRPEIACRLQWQVALAVGGVVLSVCLSVCRAPKHSGHRASRRLTLNPGSLTHSTTRHQAAVGETASRYGGWLRMY